VSFALIQPTTLPEALDALAEHGDEAKVMAGGTAVNLMLQQRLIAPDVLVDVARIPGLDAIQEGNGSPHGSLHIGALVTLRDVELSPLVDERWPGLARACQEVGNVRVRNQATLGGNLAEADYASDPPAMLLALDARVVVQNASTSRAIPLADFFYGFYTTALEPDELITGIVVPGLPASTRMTYLKFKTRSSEDRPALGVAAVGTFDDGTCRDLRVAVGAATEIPQRLPEVEALAAGQPLTDDLIAEVAEGYATQVETLDDLRGSAWYRSQMIRTHVRRALEEIRNGDR
jgi:carbon-monoxide dehydrogenase medium subunit